MLGRRGYYHTVRGGNASKLRIAGKARPLRYATANRTALNNQRLKALALLTILLGGTYALLFSNVAQAAVTLRASSSGSVTDTVALRGVSNNNNGGGTSSLALAMPTGVVENDIMVAGLTIRGGTGTTITTVPSGWTLLDQKRNQTTTLTQVIYWKKAAASEAGPYTWSFTSNKASGVLVAYSGVDTTTPIDTSNGTIGGSNTTVTTPSTSTTASNNILVGFFGVAVGENAGNEFSATSMTSIDAQDQSTGNATGSRTATAAAHITQSANPTGTYTATSVTGSVWIAQLVALKPQSGTSLTLTKPTGTVQNDVIVAALTVTGAPTITAPAGWTSIQSTATGSSEIRTQSWYLVAGASEPSSYSWSWTGAQRASGVIISYSGVDTASPLDNSTSQANASSTTIMAPSVNAAYASSMLVGIFGIANSSTITPKGLAPQNYASISTGSTLSATRVADLQLSDSGNTAYYTATAGSAGVSVGQQIALKPALASLTQASHRWFEPSTSTAGINWRNAVTDGHDWQAVTYGNGKYVAVGAAGGTGTSYYAMTSLDGNTWTEQVGAPVGDWRSIVYAQGLYVAVSPNINFDQVITSPDGITWTSRTSAADNLWQSIAYGNGLFAAVANTGTGNRVMTSPDGITWTSRTSAADNLWQSIAYGNGLFAAVANTGTGNRVMTSPDGITWTSRTSAADNTWSSVAYGNGLFVAVSQSGTGNRVMTSPDGITWTSQTSAADNAWKGVGFGNNRFIAVASTGVSNRVMISDNELHATASTWTSNPAPHYAQWRSVAYGNGLFVAVADVQVGGTRVMTSPDGITWTARTESVGNAWQSVAYGNGYFVALSSDGISSHVMTSPDGLNWTTRATPVDNSWKSITYGNGMFVAVSVSGTGNRVMTSPDGLSWFSQTSAADNSWNSVTYGNGLFVAVASTGTGNRVMKSSNGTSWTTSTSAADNSWTSVTYGNGLFVAVSSDGTGNRVMTSPDGTTWTSRTSAADNAWNAVTYGNGLFVAVAISGTGNRVMTSLDGITWTTRTSAADKAWYSVVYGAGRFVAVSADDVNGTMSAPAIDASVGTDLAAQDTALIAKASDNVRLRMNLGASTRALAPGDQKFRLQYGASSGACTGSETYYDVGTAAMTSRTSPASHGWTDVAFGNGLYVAVSAGTGSDSVMTSPDGITWTARGTPQDTNQWNAITYGNGLFVAVASSGTNRVMTSPDGITWTVRSAASALSWYSIIYGNGLFVAVADDSGSPIMTSPDGITWTSRTSPLSFIRDVTYGNGLFVGVTRAGTGQRAITSPDGITWTARTTPSPDNIWQTVTYGNGLFVALALGGTDKEVMLSSDGISWRLANSPAYVEWTEIIYANGVFVAASGNTGYGYTMYSSDGERWTLMTSNVALQWNGIAYNDGRFVFVGSDSGAGYRIANMSPPVNWNNTSAGNYGAVTSNANDPTQGGTVRAQSYITNNLIPVVTSAAAGEYGRWDFDLSLARAPYQASYCFRMVTSSGATLNTYSSYPQVTRCTVPTLDLRLRHGTAFCNGVKQRAWSSASL